MAPIKFEEKIKEQLDERRIKPSSGSWGRLNAELDKNEKPSEKSSWWLGAVAAVVVVIIIGTFVLREPAVEQPAVAEEPVEDSFQKPPENAEFQPVNELASEEENTDYPEEIEEEPEELIAVSETEKPATQNVQKKEESSPVILETIAMQPPKPKDPEAFSPENPETEKGGITDAEVDAILAKASEKLGRENSASGERITAGTLLSEIETAEDESTKTKVFQLLKEGYMKAKTAVVQRNE